jgi:hypothetical protein
MARAVMLFAPYEVFSMEVGINSFNWQLAIQSVSTDLLTSIVYDFHNHLIDLAAIPKHSADCTWDNVGRCHACLISVGCWIKAPEG